MYFLPLREGPPHVGWINLEVGSFLPSRNPMTFGLHPRKLRWIPKIAMFERRYTLQTIVFGIYLKFSGVYFILTSPFTSSKKLFFNWTTKVLDLRFHCWNRDSTINIYTPEKIMTDSTKNQGEETRSYRCSHQRMAYPKIRPAWFWGNSFDILMIGYTPKCTPSSKNRCCWGSFSRPKHVYNCSLKVLYIYTLGIQSPSENGNGT